MCKGGPSVCVWCLRVSVCVCVCVRVREREREREKEREISAYVIASLCG